ncbi:hypothetical protein OQA88_2013 [Cercophora sp. LCS_1]
MSATPVVFHHAAKAISAREFYDAVQATCLPRFPLARRGAQRPVALAISGGVDSMALAYLCSQYIRSKPNVTISDNAVKLFHAYVVDHGMRDGSGQEARDVENCLMKKLGMKATILRLRWTGILKDGQQPSDLPNVETVARELRYRAFGRVLGQVNVVSLFLGHHEDDQYETILMRLATGRHYYGLQGISPATDIPECESIHGAWRSGFVDDQMKENPYWNLRPHRHEWKSVRFSLRDSFDATMLHDGQDGGISEQELRSMDEYKKGTRIPQLAPMEIEDGGVMVYRPLLQFSKDRLIQTCLENDIPWWEDKTNADPTMTMRNAIRHLYKNHQLPVALQKPSILRLGERCRQRIAAEQAEADRLLDHVLIEDFEPAVGTAMIQARQFKFPTVPRGRWSSPERLRRRREHYRRIAAYMMLRILSLTSPKRVLPPVFNLDGHAMGLFPSLADPGDASAKGPPKAFSVEDVHFMPIVNKSPLRWLVARAPITLTGARGEAKPIVNFTRLPFDNRYKKTPSRWKDTGWRPWQLFDQRYWIRIKTRLPFDIMVMMLEEGHMKAFKNALPDDGTRDVFSATLSRYAPKKVRYSLPALYVPVNVTELIAGGPHWPESLVTLVNEAGDAAGRWDSYAKMRAWERDVALKGEKQLLALPTLGFQLPGLENWLQWESSASVFLIPGVAVLLLSVACLTTDMWSSLRYGGQILSGLALTGTSVADAIDIGWYPPARSPINNLSAVVNGKGVYGFIYNSSSTPDDIYGTYNWCNMPHVRPKEYKKLNDSYELAYVEVIHRHHKRTPYSANLFPVEPLPWNCDTVALYHHSSPLPLSNTTVSTPTYWQTTLSELNPFPISPGACQFPQITNPSLHDCWHHGHDLAAAYATLLSHGKTIYRVTNNQITSQVAGMVINGMTLSTTPHPLHIQPAQIDSLEPRYPCPAATSLFSKIKSSPSWKAHLDAARPLFQTLDTITGVSPSDPGFHADLDHYYDNLSARQCHGRELPEGMAQETADAVYRFGQWEYDYVYRSAGPEALAACVASMGVWIAELVGNIRAVVEGRGDGVVYRHNVAHDGSLSRVLGVLQVEEMVWPGMGAEAVFEVYKGEDGWFVRVLFGGRVLRSSSPALGVMDLVEVERLLGYFDGLVGRGGELVVGKCAAVV